MVRRRLILRYCGTDHGEAPETVVNSMFIVCVAVVVNGYRVSRNQYAIVTY